MGEHSQIVQECLGSECPIIEEHKTCPYKLEIDNTEICTIEHSKPVHSYSEIAKILGISKQAVMYLEKKALRKLRDKMVGQLRQEGLDPSDLL